MDGVKTRRGESRPAWRSCRKFLRTQNRVFPLCYGCRTSRKKFVMHTLTRLPLILAPLLVGGYVFGARVLVAHAQAQQPLYTPGPPVPTTPGSNVPPPVPTTPGSSVTPPVHEPPSAARTHKRTSVAKPVHHRSRSIVAGQILPYDWRFYWDPRLSCCCCPVWNYPYGPDWLLRRVWPASP
jgi:hypothetical protein